MNTCHENPHDHFSLWVVRNSVKMAYLVHKDKNFLWVLLLHEQATGNLTAKSRFQLSKFGHRKHGTKTCTVTHHRQFLNIIV